MDSTRTRTYTWDDPMIGVNEGKQISGLDYMQRIIRGEIARPPIAVTMNAKLVEVSEGRAVFVVQPEEYHYNPMGIVHGGLACTLLDSAMGCAVHTTLPAGVGYTTLDVHVNFIRAMTKDTGEMRCEGEVIHAGQRTATAQARLIDGAGKLYGHGTTTCMIFR